MSPTELDQLFRAIGRSLHGEPPFFIWPAPLSTPAECEFYLADHYLPELYRDLKALQERGRSVEEIASLFRYPSRLAQVMWLFGHVTNLDQARRRELTDLASTILEILSHMREDPFVSSGENPLWTKREILAATSTGSLVHAKREDWDTWKRGLLRLQGTLWVYSELLFFSIHEVCKEFHGPYKLDDGRWLLTRHYYDLKPGFWSFSGDLPFESCTIVSLYEGDVSASFDFFGRFRTRANLENQLVGLAVSVDGQSCENPDNLQGTLRSLAGVASAGASLLRAMDREQVMGKFAAAYNHIRVPAAIASERSPAVPGAVLEDITREAKRSYVEEAYRRFREMPQLTADEQELLLAKAFDPRRR